MTEPDYTVKVERADEELLVIDGLAIARAFFEGDASSVGPNSYDAAAGKGAATRIEIADVETMNRMIRPLRLMSPQQVVAEGLGALRANRSTHIAGTANRVLASMLPRRFFTAMTASMSARVRARLVGAGVSRPSS